MHENINSFRWLNVCVKWKFGISLQYACTQHTTGLGENYPGKWDMCQGKIT